MLSDIDPQKFFLRTAPSAKSKEPEKLENSINSKSNQTQDHQQKVCFVGHVKILNLQTRFRVVARGGPPGPRP